MDRKSQFWLSWFGTSAAFAGAIGILAIGIFILKSSCGTSFDGVDYYCKKQPCYHRIDLVVLSFAALFIALVVIVFSCMVQEALETKKSDPPNL